MAQSKNKDGPLDQDHSGAVSEIRTHELRIMSAFTITPIIEALKTMSDATTTASSKDLCVRSDTHIRSVRRQTPRESGNSGGYVFSMRDFSGSDRFTAQIY